MGALLVGLEDLDRSAVGRVGGKAASLGELIRLADVRVPPGFCVPTGVFHRALGAGIDGPLDHLAGLSPDDRDAIRAGSAELRRRVEALPIPGDLAREVGAALGSDPGAAWAVRSSATAEDSPSTSFAGLHDSALGVVGVDAVLAEIRRCWASSFTERAVAYRLRSDLDVRAGMAVVVQRMLAPRVSGVAFTADPVGGHRKVTVIEAVPGLGDALVSGRVNPDVWRLRDGVVRTRTLVGSRPTLTDDEALALEALGRRIEAHFGRPQDVEWCLDDDGFAVVQSRPITTLFPIPAREDRERHVYVSVGHQQMMTDPMTPLGGSLWQRLAARPMFEAGGRLFVDVVAELGAPATRAGLLAVMGAEPLIRDALQAVLAQDFVPPLPDRPRPAPPGGPPPELEADPTLVAGLIARQDASVAAAEQALDGLSGPAAIDALLADAQAQKASLSDPLSYRVILAVIDDARWLNERLQEWLGWKNAADTFTRSVPGNVTSEMGLALLDVADVVRAHPAVVAFLREVRDDDLLHPLPAIDGGGEVRDALQAWLDRYGARCVGEIDVARPRWRERPRALLPLLLSHVDRFAPGEAARRFEAGRRAAEDATREALARVRTLPDGDQKADEVRRRVARLRAFAGYREYPKYALIRRTFVYRRTLLVEARRLVAAGVLRDAEDVWWSTLPELAEVARSGRVEGALLREREAAFRASAALHPPRVLTSDGERFDGAYRRDDVPPGALVGLAVSSGTVEGRARVVLDPDAPLEPGDILVTTFTDPSWTPRFLGIAGLVTEVGGLMTHGAVIAREYGLPAVVGVPHATREIRDGQRIRVHGADGYVERLD